MTMLKMTNRQQMQVFLLVAASKLKCLNLNLYIYLFIYLFLGKMFDTFRTFREHVFAIRQHDEL